jgi:hypothetical protein
LIVGPGGRCLEVAGEAVEGAGTRLATCLSETDQAWSLASDGHVQAASGLCLDVGDSADGTPTTLMPCSDGAGQSWAKTAAGQLQGLGGKCLSLNTDAGGSLELSACVDAPSQKWRAYP